MGAGLQELSPEGDLILYYVWDVTGDGRKFLASNLFCSLLSLLFLILSSKKHSPARQWWYVPLFIYVCLLILVFQHRVSLCSPGFLGTHYVDQAGLEICLPLPPKCWN